MNPEARPLARMLIVVTADPLKSGRLAEAIRMAAGVSAWKKVSVTLFVGGEAISGLLPGEGRFVDEDNIVDFLPALAGRKQEVFLEAGHPLIADHRSELSFPELDSTGLADLASHQDYVMRF